MKSKYTGSIAAVRDVEDSIRATGKYTKGAFSRKAAHPVQGDDTPSRTITEYYEVYPDININEAQSFWGVLSKTADWLWGETRIDVRFNYSYRDGKAVAIVLGGEGAVKALEEGIPGFKEALERVSLVVYNANGTQRETQVVVDSHG